MKANKTADAVSAKHLANLLARPPVELQIRSAKKLQNNLVSQFAKIAWFSGLFLCCKDFNNDSFFQT